MGQTCRYHWISQPSIVRSVDVISMIEILMMGKITGAGSVSKKDLLFAMNTILKRSASGAGQGSIDNRIEQAMDLVKSHLMSAVRSEVEELRDKISKLEDTVTLLSRENEVLRANVNPEVLASLTGNRNLVGGMTSISNHPCQPPDPTSHPALQPPNQH